MITCPFTTKVYPTLRNVVRNILGGNDFSCIKVAFTRTKTKHSSCATLACKTNEGAFIKQVVRPVYHGEGPHWSEKEQALYFVDIDGPCQSVNRYDPATNEHTCIFVNRSVSTVIPVKDSPGEFVLGFGKGIYQLKWDGKSDKYRLAKKYLVAENKTHHRFNDGKADAEGRLFIGTMDDGKDLILPNEGTLYKLANGKLTVEITPVTISNGITWSVNNKLMYYTDTPTNKIEVLDYDLSTGEMSNRRNFFDFKKNKIEGSPDGMTTDRDGNIWVACWNGGQVIQISKKGKLMRKIKLPSRLISSVAWGDKDLNTLYVTSQYQKTTKKELLENPFSGGVFAVSGLGIEGLSAGMEVSPSCFIGECQEKKINKK